MTAQILEAVADGLSAMDPALRLDAWPADGPLLAPEALRQVIKRRRARDACFPPGLFADPAWDILLDLTIARLEGQDLSVTNVCVAAAVPQTTALRWVASLERRGLVDRIADPHDLRRMIVRLSAEGWARMERYLTLTGIGLT